MKTSVIRYRVADFLREYPPFETFSLEDLLAFSGTGKVLFHEDDIYVFRKGEARNPLFWVIQQGQIEVLDESPMGERLCDVLGPGDILGLARAQDATTHPLTARTVTDVILYSFDETSFETLAGKYPEAARYLTAHLSASARHTKALQAPVNRDRLLTEREKTSWLRVTNAPPAWLRQRQAICGADLPLREAAALLTQSRNRAVGVVSDTGQPLGLVTERDLPALADAADTPVGACLNRDFHTAPPKLGTADYLLRMLQNRCQTLVITVDGTTNTPVEDIVTDSSLAIHCGRIPTLYQQEMLAADSVEELAYLCNRARAFLAEELAGPSVVEWFWQMQTELHHVLLERLVSIAKTELANAGRNHPPIAFCWLGFGKAARRELLMPDLPAFGLLYADSPAHLETETAEYFSTLARKVEAKLKACIGKNRTPSHTIAARSLSAWKHVYTGLIQNPIGNSIYSARELFDLRPVYGDAALAADLRETIHAALQQQEMFIPVLANDTLANLPPLTFFQGSVVESDGTRKQTLNLEKTALLPLCDATRVFALNDGNLSASNTLDRLDTATRWLPQYASTFRDAADALRIASYQHAVASFDAGESNDVVITPARLGRFEQRLLKSAFDAVRRLLELTATIHPLLDPK